MFSKTVLSIVSILLLGACTKGDQSAFEARVGDPQTLSCRITNAYSYGFLGDGNLKELFPDNDSSHELTTFDGLSTFTVDIGSGVLTTGLEDVCCDRALEMVVVSKGSRDGEFWAAYQATFYDLVMQKWIEILLIEVNQSGGDMAFALSGSGESKTGKCVEE